VRGHLTPVSSSLPDCLSQPSVSRQPYARIDRRRLVALAAAMPDCQSAVLACLAWQASLQERLARGPYAGQFVARLSGARLAKMTGRPLRTVRHALSRLTSAGVIRRVNTASGKTAVYALKLVEPQPPD
jgi:hypothetical protein